MSFQLTLTEKPGYVHAVVTGRRLETWDVYQIASEGSMQGSGAFETVAFVDVNAQGELMRFAETVANNRGVPVNVFATVAEAEAWLRTKIC